MTTAMQEILSNIKSDANMLTGGSYPRALRFQAGRLELCVRRHLDRDFVSHSRVCLLRRARNLLMREANLGCLAV